MCRTLILRSMSGLKYICIRLRAAVEQKHVAFCIRTEYLLEKQGIIIRSSSIKKVMLRYIQDNKKFASHYSGYSVESTLYHQIHKNPDW